jgi:hypothetical protein
MQNPVSCQSDVYEGIFQPLPVWKAIYFNILFSYRSNSFLKVITSDAWGIYLCVTFLH